MDIDQRKYLIERIKKEYNNVIAPFSNKNQKAEHQYLTHHEMEAALRVGDCSLVSSFSSDVFGNPPDYITVYFHPKTTIIPPNYASLLEKLSAERNKVLDTIMLGDIPNASEILSNFIKFLNNEKEKPNGN